MRRFSRRPDLAALALFLTFAAFMNALGMVTPVYALEAWLGAGACAHPPAASSVMRMINP